MLSFDEALVHLLSAARAPLQTETVPLAAALNRVLAADVVSPLDVPGFDNSAMDGYALNIPDFANPPASFKLAGRIAAGDAAEAPLLPGEAARIFTGAPLPAGANAVAMQEVCTVADGSVAVADKLKPGLNIRRRGEEIAAGSVVMERGIRLTPQAIGLAAAVGCAELAVYAPLRVALISTGSELVEPGSPLALGQIYNSNRYALLGLLNSLGCAVTDLGIVPDNLPATLATLESAAESHDVVVTTGGVSVGEEDHVRTAVQTLGVLNLWKINIKPGKPFALGRIGDADFIGLPGNPVSSFVTFLMLARSFLLKRQGLQRVLPKRLQLPAAFEWPRANPRREFLRARINAGGAVELFKSQGSAMLSSLVWAEGLAVVREAQTIQPGDLVDYLSLSELI